MKTAVLSGGSSGIGRECALLLAKNGYKVYELSRHGSDFYEVTHMTADVTDEESVHDALAKVYSADGRIDLLVCSAGFGISGAAEFTELDEAKLQFDVNFFGMFICIKHALPYLRKSKGRIINISSAAGVYPIPFQSFYSASKAAINSFSMSLANETRGFGIKVTAVMPGDIKTGFTDARHKQNSGRNLYTSLDKAVTSMERDERNGMPPVRVAEVVLRAAVCRNPAPLYTVGAQYKAMLFLDRILPHRLVNYILYKMYC